MVSNLIYLRILAILLIVNSHLAAMYPFPQLAFGGFLGNSIFYLISGVGLSLSYQRNPVSALTWSQKRILKVGIPLLLFIGILNLGDWQGFWASISHRIIWHETNQLRSFLPVLWGLYILFLPINRMTVEKTRTAITLLLLITAGLFVYKVLTLESIPYDLPSNEMFFPLNALLCFTLGIYLTKTNILSNNLNHDKRIIVICIAFIFCSQAMHQYFKFLGEKYLPLNFYLNIISILALYALSNSVTIKTSGKFTTFLYALASSSLAVYLLQFKMIKIISATSIQFPYNILCMYLYTFIFAYSLTKLSNFISEYAMSQTMKKARQHPD